MLIRKPEPPLAPPHIVLLALLLILFTPRTAIAQVPWESPLMGASNGTAGVSLLYVDFGLRPFDGTGLMLYAKPSSATRNIAFRVAATLPGSDRTRVSGGVDIALPLFRRTATFPLDVQLHSGVGGGYGDYWTAALPVGMSAGRSFDRSTVRFAPWTGARTVIDVAFGAEAPERTATVNVAAELGTDVWVRGADAVRLRTALSLGDRRAVVIGLHVGRSAPRAVAAHRP